MHSSNTTQTTHSHLSLPNILPHKQQRIQNQTYTLCDTHHHAHESKLCDRFPGGNHRQPYDKPPGKQASTTSNSLCTIQRQHTRHHHTSTPQHHHRTQHIIPKFTTKIRHTHQYQFLRSPGIVFSSHLSAHGK